MLRKGSKPHKFPTAALKSTKVGHSGRHGTLLQNCYSGWAGVSGHKSVFMSALEAWLHSGQIPDERFTTLTTAPPFKSYLSFKS